MSDDLDFEMEVVEGGESNLSEETEVGRSGNERSTDRASQPKKVRETRMPVENWDRVKLQEVAVRRSENVDPEEAELDRHVGLEHITPDNPVPNYESLDGQSSTKRHFLPGDILYAKLRPYLRKAAHPDFEGLCTSEIIPIVAGDAINSKFLLYRLSSKRAFDYAIRTSIGTRMPRTSWNLFQNFEFELPPLPEQRKIASILYAVDQAIQKTEEIIEQAYRVKRGLVQDLFHGKDKVYEDYKSTPVGEVPSHWSVTNIGAVVEMAQYGISESMSEDGMYPIFRMNNIENGYMVGEPMKYIDLDNREFEKYRVEKGDILFNRTNSLELVGKTGIFELEGDYVFASYLVRLRANEEVDPYYLNFYMNSFEGQNRMMDFATKGVSQANINANSIQQVKLPLPPKDEQQDIAAKIRAFDQEIGHHNEYAAQLKDLKKGLMQDLLTGEVRTADKAIEVLEEVQSHG